MNRVLLIHCRKISHYRIPIYGYLSNYLKRFDFDFLVTSDGIQDDNPHSLDFKYFQTPLTILSIVRLIIKERIDTIIMFVDMRHLYLFPTYLIAKYIFQKKIIYWGQGRDLLDAQAKIKNLAYAIEQLMCDAIILYAENLKKYVPKCFHKKIFVANNTLHLTYPGLLNITKEQVLAKYRIHTRKNIICMGRMQKRKRLDHIVEALALMNRSDIGLILVGPDQDDILNTINGPNIFKLGPIYGDEKFDLLSVSDVYCLPGAVGLSIIDAFHCGLPFVTEFGDESAEIMYLKDGVNGFVVQRGDISSLSRKLKLLLDDDNLRQQFSNAAKKEIAGNGNIAVMGKGFKDALCYATNQS